MPYKYPEDKGWKVPKQKYKLKNWSKYSNALKDRGRIDFWLDKEGPLIIGTKKIRRILDLGLLDNILISV